LRKELDLAWQVWLGLFRTVRFGQAGIREVANARRIMGGFLVFGKKVSL
jgi:hypothetical protein